MTLEPPSEPLPNPPPLPLPLPLSVPMPPAAWLTRAQASAYLASRGIHMKPTTLARAYSTGSGGPPCRHIRNKPHYTQKNRDLIARGATSSPDDPKLEVALKLGAAADGSANWASMVLKLFEGPKDKIDLSDDARSLVGTIKDTPRLSNQYQEGSIASKTV